MEKVSKYQSVTLWCFTIFVSDVRIIGTESPDFNTTLLLNFGFIILGRIYSCNTQLKQQLKLNKNNTNWKLNKKNFF